MDYLIYKDGKNSFIVRVPSRGTFEIWREGKWHDETSSVLSMLRNGELDEISIEEAERYIQD